MKFHHGYAHVPDYLQGTVATIGNFDGVHLGHQALIQALIKEGERIQCPTLVVLFEPQPSEYFLKNKAPIRITTLREKLDLLQKCGVNFVHCFPFNKHLATMSFAAFARDILLDILQTRTLMIGQDFRFGKGREGDSSKLISLETSIEVKIFKDYTENNKRVSSTLIREALASSNLNLAASLLGRSYSMCGRVIKGEGRGRQLDAPTANILINRIHLPVRGVFLVSVEYNALKLPGIANIGVKPTFDGSRPCLEVHILGWQGDIYGQLLKINFLQKVRDEMKFASINDLKTQIQIDIQQAKAFFKTESTYID